MKNPILILFVWSLFACNNIEKKESFLNAKEHIYIWNVVAQKLCRERIVFGQDSIFFGDMIKSEVLDSNTYFSHFDQFHSYYNKLEVDCRGFYDFGVIRFNGNRIFNKYLENIFSPEDFKYYFNSVHNELTYIVNFGEGGVILQDISVDFDYGKVLDVPIGILKGQAIPLEWEDIESKYMSGKNTSQRRYSEIIIRKRNNEVDYNSIVKGHSAIIRRNILNDIISYNEVQLALDTFEQIFIPIKLDPNLFFKNEGHLF